jgi:hypothetical protein
VVALSTGRGRQLFFCNKGSDKNVLHEVTSFNVGRQIREAVELSGNREWQVKLQPLNPDDARAIDIKLYCYVKHVRLSGVHDVPVPTNDDLIHQISVDTEFFSILRNMLTEGTFLSMDTIRGIYEQLMQSHGSNKSYSSKEVKAKILHNMPGEVEFARPYFNRPETVCSSESKNAAVRDAAKQAGNPQQDILTIMNCATIIRRDILAASSQKWSFNGSLCCDDRQQRVPVSLQMLLKWILRGTGNGTEVRNEEVEQASLRLSQNIMYETKSNCQVSYQAKGASRRFNHSRYAENEQVLAVAFKVHSYIHRISITAVNSNYLFCLPVMLAACTWLMQLFI